MDDDDTTEPTGEGFLEAVELGFGGRPGEGDIYERRHGYKSSSHPIQESEAPETKS
jgi:hypothetical protein